MSCYVYRVRYILHGLHISSEGVVLLEAQTDR